MRSCTRRAFIAFLSALAFEVVAHAQITNFQHVVLVIQENRTPDNLFYALCTPLSLCSTTPTSKQYDIQTSNWLDKTQPGGVIQPQSVSLIGGYDLRHAHTGFTSQCDLNPATNVCRMDGASAKGCSGNCPSQANYRYVDNSTGIITPYLQMVLQYGWANYMFQTNQGPSFPAHQFLFGATSALSAADDAAGIFVATNVGEAHGTTGCTAVAGSWIQLISFPNVMGSKVYPCMDHDTLPDVLPSSVSWKYYAPSGISDWNAPSAISHICQPSTPTGGQCLGPEWVNNVALNPKDILIDIQNCNLRNLVWSIPTADNSDHGGLTQGGGPSWVASIVNAIGSSTCKNPDGSSYWDTTAIFITWDDWGGWYDHEPPTILAQPQGDYQYGFRVPLIVISAYTPAGYIDNTRDDFGSIIRFIEKNFGAEQGILNFADARASDNLSGFFNLSGSPRPFVVIPSVLTAEDFINDTKPPQDPDEY
jgi:phospholipase C